MHGRAREQARLLALLEDIDARGSALVIRGAAGIGKSTLVDHARSAAIDRGFRVLTCAGAQRDSNAGMAGLQQLLHVVVDRADQLPERQQAALRSLFGLGPSISPDQLVLSVAVLGLLENLAQQQPLLLIVEDLQWMDQPTANMIGFVGRRLRETAIIMLITCRADGPDPAADLGLPELPLGRLTDDEGAGLLAELSPSMRREMRDRVLAEAEGNPLALVELSRGLLDRGLHDASRLPLRLPLGARLENAFADQVARLSVPAQDYLLLAAGHTGITPAELDRAARRLGVDAPEDCLREAEDAGLVRSTGGVPGFRHPLIQSAIYGAATFPRRIAAHRALAEVYAAEPERAAWHRSAATVGRDELVARDLETAAGLAGGRGDLGGAMRYLERAADLSPAPDEMARRLARAAEAARRSGLSTAVIRLVTAATAVTSDPVVLADLALTESRLGLTTDAAGPDTDQLITLARRAVAADREVAANLYTFVALRCALYTPGAAVGDLVLDEMQRLLPDEDPRLLMAEATLAPVRYVDRISGAVRAATRDSASLTPLWAGGLATAAESLHDWVLAGHCWAVAVAGYRRSGEVSDLVNTQLRQSRNMLIRGDLSDAALIGGEAHRLGTDLGLPALVAHGALMTAHVAAWRGDDAVVAASLAAVAELVAVPRAELIMLTTWARGIWALGAGRYDEAYDELSAVVGHPDFGPLVVADLAEAAYRRGTLDQAAEVVAAVGERVRPLGSPLLRMLIDRGQGVLAADDEQAERYFRRARDEPGAADYPLQVARTRLAYGGWLRRRRRTAAARDELAAAQAVFDQAGAHPWAARAKAELRAAGVAVQGPAEPRDVVLTAQELQIARFAAEGRTNKEIADLLFLSHRTVGAHLYRIFPKLGITSRAALRDAIADLT
ncbi:ATP-binding protein [Actinoplanes rectilineatus]|uniref:ATP-binding protein n=1 Tax=Actinoplanes rectilineatus TaxID=113571 RepID=UPI0005F2D070|nr:LuxR family transcriptional regulator [Actinoplanes rectilineatus]